MAKKRATRGALSQPMEMMEWEVERDLDALARAKAVQKDPERMKKVKALAAKKLEDSKRREDEARYMVDLGEGKTGEAQI